MCRFSLAFGRFRVYGATLFLALFAAVRAQSLSSVSVTPIAVLGGASASGTVTLSGKAPSAGTTVTLSSSNPAASVPTTVKVPSGATTAKFTIKSLPVAADVTVTLSATLNAKVVKATLVVDAPKVTTIVLSPTSVTGGATATGKVTLTGAAASGLKVSLLSNRSAVQVPTSVTFTLGATSATFTATTSPVTSTVAAISASFNGVTASANLTVTPPALSSLVVLPSTVVSGNSATATVTLTGSAPTGGETVALKSYESFAQVPASVIVPAGSTSANFPVTTSYVFPTSTALLGAIFAGKNAYAKLTVTPGNPLSSGPWPKFMADAQNTGQGVGQKSNGNLAWQADFHGGVYNQPAVGATAFAVAADYLTPYIGSYNNPRRTFILGLDGSFRQSIDGIADITSTPIVGANGMFYQTSTKGLVAYAADGSIKWRYAASWNYGPSCFAGSGMAYTGLGTAIALDKDGQVQWTVPNVQPVALAPDGNLYCLPNSSSLQVCALSPSGSLKCTWSAPSGISNYSAWGQAVGADGTLYFICGNSLVALGAEGTLRWSYAASALINQAPAIAPNGTIYIATVDRNLTAVSATGRLIWRQPLPASSNLPNQLFAGPDSTFYLLGDQLGTHAPTVTALTPGGATKWTWTSNFVGQAQTSGGIAANGSLIVCAGYWAGPEFTGSAVTQPPSSRVYRISPSGVVEWQFLAGGGEQAPAIGADGTLYEGCSCGALRTLHPDGTPGWAFAAGGAIGSTPTLGSDGTVYFGGADSNLYALTSAGVLKWRCKVSGPITGSPTIGWNGLIYATSNDGAVHAVNYAGSVVWSYKVGIPVYDCTPALGSDGTVYVCGIATAGSNAQLLALTADGAPKWSVNVQGGYSYGSPAVGFDGKIYVPDVSAFTTQGKLLWTYKNAGFASSPSAGEGVYGTFAVGAGLLNELGEAVWVDYLNKTVFAGGEVQPFPIALDGTFYAPTMGSVDAVTPGGAVLWTFNPYDDAVNACSIGADGTVYASSQNGIIYALK